MKKILATLAISAISAAAFAGVTFEGRYDYASDTTNSTTNTNQSGTSGFFWNTAKMGFSGKASDSVTAKAKLNFISSGNLHVNGKDLGAGYKGTGVVATDATADLVESAEVTQKFSDAFSATFGKLSNPGMSGFEGQEAPMYQYFFSQGYNFPHVTGMALSYEVAAGQNVTLAFFNGTATYATDNTRTGAGLIYSGSFGNMGVMASYHTNPQGVSGTNNVDATYTTVGFSYKMDAWSFAFDYDMNAISKAASSGNDKKVNAMVFSAHYNMGQWTPGLKFESSTSTGYQTAGTTDADITYTNFAIFGDYKANAADNFGYHLAYVSRATKYSAKAAFTGMTNDNVTETLAYAGLTYTGDFLK